MSPRSRAREVVLQLLYQQDLNSTTSATGSERFLHGRLRDPRLERFAADLLVGVQTQRAELDQAIAATAENWRLERMAAIDRNILRLGAYELLFSDTPPRVVIDEAVELAKRYGSAQSGQFVNGILDRLMAGARPQGAATAASESSDVAEASESPPSTDEPLRS